MSREYYVCDLEFPDPETGWQPVLADVMATLPPSRKGIILPPADPQTGEPVLKSAFVMLDLPDHRSVQARAKVRHIPNLPPAAHSSTLDPAIRGPLRADLEARGFSAIVGKLEFPAGWGEFLRALLGHLNPQADPYNLDTFLLANPQG